MGVIIRLAPDKYVEWSSCVDAPVSSVLSLQDVKDYVYSEEERKHGKRDLEDEGELGEALRKSVKLLAEARLARLEKTGTTAIDGDGLARALRYNRAGPGETHLKTAKEIIDTYTYTPEKKGKWPFPKG